MLFHWEPRYPFDVIALGSKIEPKLRNTHIIRGLALSVTCCMIRGGGENEAGGFMCFPLHCTPVTHTVCSQALQSTIWVLSDFYWLPCFIYWFRSNEVIMRKGRKKVHHDLIATVADHWAGLHIRSFGSVQQDVVTRSQRSHSVCSGLSRTAARSCDRKTGQTQPVRKIAVPFFSQETACDRSINGCVRVIQWNGPVSVHVGIVG